MKGAHKIARAKVETVKQFEAFVKEYPIVGIVNMENLPAKQLQNMRQQLRGTVHIIMTKKRLIRIILNNSKGTKADIERLETHIRGMPAMLFTKENPFKLYKKLQENKSTAPAKAGQTAPRDIVVPAGPTPFAPGPIIGELGQLRIKSGIEDGKVAIKEAATVVKAGEEIKPKVASILTRLGIEPMEIGLDLVAVYEDGSIYTRDVLSVDEKQYMDNLAAAAGDALSLALGIGYVSPDTVTLLVQKAYRDARSLGRAQDILADDLVGELLAKAELQMLGLKSQIERR
jgi:large subunit ribosomal protein L10